jgi:hypothetical protein
MCVCMHVCMHICMHVCMYVSMHVCMHVCVYACIYVMYVYVCMYVCTMLCLASGNIKISVETSKVDPTPKWTKEHKRYLSRLVWKICFRCTTAGPNVNYKY